MRKKNFTFFITIPESRDSFLFEKLLDMLRSEAGTIKDISRGHGNITYEIFQFSAPEVARWLSRGLVLTAHKNYDRFGRDPFAKPTEYPEQVKW